MDEAGLAMVDSPAVHQDLSAEGEALAAYFQLGFTNAQICAVLEHSHGLADLDTRSSNYRNV